MDPLPSVAFASSGRSASTHLGLCPVLDNVFETMHDLTDDPTYSIDQLSPTALTKSRLFIMPDTPLITF